MGFCGLEDELDDLLLSRLSNHVVLGVKLDIVDIFHCVCTEMKLCGLLVELDGIVEGQSMNDIERIRKHGTML